MLNTINQIDCLEGMKQLPTDYIDLTVTSPPYDGLRVYNGYSFDFENIATELFRVTKPGGIVVWVVGDATVKGSESGTSFRQALHFKEVGFNLHDTMIYKKANSLPQEQHPRYRPSFEYMFVLCKGYPPKTFNPIKTRNTNAGASYTNKGQRNADNTFRHEQAKPGVVKEFSIKDNVWEYQTGFNRVTTDEYAYDHPAIFPEQLAEDHILSWSNPGDLVMDIFTGSGTTGKMAVANERNFIGFEISEKYAEIAKRRIANVQPVMNF